MTDYRTIIDERGGIRALARALGHRSHTTVQGWRDRNLIPERHRHAVLAVARVERAKRQKDAAA